MSSQSSANRWVPFQCPLCFGLFRLRKAQIGSAGHCPTCRSLLHVSGKPSPVSSAPEALVEEPDEALFDRLAVAETMSPEEVAEQEMARSNRVRHYSGAASDTIEWEGENDEDPSKKGPSWLLLSGGLMALVLVLAGGLFYVKTWAPDPSNEKQSVVADAAAQEKLDEILAKDRADSYRDEDGVDSTVEVVDQYKKFDIMKVEETVKAFLNSETVEERLKYVREPDRVRPLMLSFYGGEEIEAEGFEALNKSKVSYFEAFLTAFVQTADFLTYTIAVERQGEDAEALYKIDWESWVGYCDLKPEQMKAERPTQPVRMRVIVSDASYYNYGFSDDREWACYRLVMRDSEYTFLGYAKRGSEMVKEFEKFLKDGGSDPFLVNVVYPPNARSGDQVEIVDILSSGWILDTKEEKNDE